MRRDARMKLDLFKKDPAKFRSQFMQGEAFQELSDQEIEDQLRSQATADSKTLKAMRQMGGGNLDSLTDEQIKKNSELQLKMFNDNPKTARKRMEEQNPQVKQLTDDQLRMQLETMASMSAADIRSMQKMAAGGGMPQIDPNDPNATKMSMDRMNDMSPEQLSAMFKMQRDMFKKDPVAFKKQMPQFASMPDSMIQSQLDTMADMPPENLKFYLNASNTFLPYLNMLKEPLDKISGGRGAQILSAIALFLVMVIVYYLVGFLIKILGMVFPTTFGTSGAVETTIQDRSAATTGGGVEQVDLNVDDEFFQQDDL